MPAYGIADSSELAVLTKALDDYCAGHRITSEEGREQIAVKVMFLFRSGTKPEQISEVLDKVG